MNLFDPKEKLCYQFQNISMHNALTGLLAGLLVGLVVIFLNHRKIQKTGLFVPVKFIPLDPFLHASLKKIAKPDQEFKEMVLLFEDVMDNLVNRFLKNQPFNFLEYQRNMQQIQKSKFFNHDLEIICTNLNSRICPS